MKADFSEFHGIKVLQKSLEIELVQAAANGDADSFAELCRRWYPSMVAIADAVLGDRHLAEDAAQQVFAKAACKLAQLKDKNRFGGWLAVICRNVARDMARRREKLVSSDDITMIAQVPKQGGMTENVRDAVNSLSVTERELIYLRFYDGLTYGQITAVLGVSKQALNGRLRRAKKKVAKYLTRNGFVEVKL